MAITTLCLLQLQTSEAALNPAIRQKLGLRIKPLTGGVLLHTGLDFSSEPEALAGAIRQALGEALAEQHADSRGVLLIPSIAAPKARTYAEVIDEVGEGGVWAQWSAAGREAPDLSGLLGQMLGQIPGGLDPSALQAASAALPGLLSNPDELAQLVKTASAELPQLDQLLRGLGIDLGSGDLQRMTGALADELGRDPDKLAALAEQFFEQAGDYEEEDDGETDDDDTPAAPRDKS